MDNHLCLIFDKLPYLTYHKFVSCKNAYCSNKLLLLFMYVNRSEILYRVVSEVRSITRGNLNPGQKAKFCKKCFYKKRRILCSLHDPTVKCRQSVCFSKPKYFIFCSFRTLLPNERELRKSRRKRLFTIDNDRLDSLVSFGEDHSNGYRLDETRWELSSKYSNCYRWVNTGAVLVYQTTGTHWARSGQDIDVK